MDAAAAASLHSAPTQPEVSGMYASGYKALDPESNTQQPQTTLNSHPARF